MFQKSRWLPLGLGLLVFVASLALACASAAPPPTSTPSSTPVVDGSIPTPRQATEEAPTPMPMATRVPRATSQETVAIPATTSVPTEAPEATPQSTGPDDDDQALSVPDKEDLKYPNLGSRLGGLVARVEAGQTTAEEAAADTPVHSGGSVAVTIYLSGSVDGVVSFLEENGGDPRNVGEDYVEAYVPVALLGPVSARPGVIRVREIVPPEPQRGG